MISGAAGVLTPCRVGVWVSCGHGVATARVTGVNNLHVSRRIVDGGTCSTVLCTVTTVELARIPRGDKVFVVDGGRLRRLGPCPPTTSAASAEHAQRSLRTARHTQLYNVEHRYR